MEEDKKIHEEEMGQEIEYEAEENLDLDDMIESDNAKVDSKKTNISTKKIYLAWILIFTIIIAIVLGWYYFFKLNMNKINAKIEAQKENATQKTLEEMKNTFDQARKVIEDTKQGMNQLTADKNASTSLEVEKK